MVATKVVPVGRGLTPTVSPLSVQARLGRSAKRCSKFGVNDPGPAQQRWQPTTLLQVGPVLPRRSSMPFGPTGTLTMPCTGYSPALSAHTTNRLLLAIARKISLFYGLLPFTCSTTKPPLTWVLKPNVSVLAGVMPTCLRFFHFSGHCPGIQHGTA